MLNFEPVDECISYLRLKGKFFNITIICVHVPPEGNCDIVKSFYYDRTNTVNQTIPKHDAVKVTGNTNVTVSKDSFTPCTGK